MNRDEVSVVTPVKELVPWRILHLSLEKGM